MAQTDDPRSRGPPTAKHAKIALGEQRRLAVVPLVPAAGGQKSQRAAGARKFEELPLLQLAAGAVSAAACALMRQLPHDSRSSTVAVSSRVPKRGRRPVQGSCCEAQGGRMTPSRKGSRTIISTVVSGDSVQQNDSRGQVDERRSPT